MIRRLVSLVLVAWVFGFLWFAITLPRPAGPAKTDAIVVPTGGAGRIQRGLALLQQGQAPRMLVTGVDLDVKPTEFAAEYNVPPPTMACCVTLGFTALDTRGNARETAEWTRERKVRSVRLVTSDWHMRRFAREVGATLPAGVTVVRDAVRTQPSLGILLLEYHKLIATWLAQLF
ncbi:MAG: YdcF family protein [Croceibacterium sp.]